MSNYIIYTLASFVVSLPLAILYLNYGRKIKILAHVNKRSLHDQPIITGGGLIIGIVILLLIILNITQKSNFFNFTTLLFTVSFFFAIIGWIDDRIEIKAKIKFLIQILFSSVFVFIYLFLLPLDFDPSIFVALFFSLIFLLVSSVNAFNFMDGINGLALSLSFYIFLCLLVLNPEIEIKYELTFLMITILVLLYFNVLNKLFIGDAGSMLLGFLLGALIINEIIYQNINIFTILIFLAYWVSDTICTFLARLLTVKKWYLAHRSHAYQNLARLMGSHYKPLAIINIINFLYLLPMAFFSQLYFDFILYFIFFSYLPMIIISLKYGPLLSSD